MPSRNQWLDAYAEAILRKARQADRLAEKPKFLRQQNLAESELERRDKALQDQIVPQDLSADDVAAALKLLRR